MTTKRKPKYHDVMHIRISRPLGFKARLRAAMSILFSSSVVSYDVTVRRADEKVFERLGLIGES